MNARKIIELCEQIDSESTVLSTGQNPSCWRDLLVIGQLSRQEFFHALIDCTGSKSTWSDDALMFSETSRDGNLGVAYYDENSFTGMIYTIAEGVNLDPIVKHWAQGPWLPEVFASDISRAIVLRQGRDSASQSMHRFDMYPEKMRKAIIERCLAEISIKSSVTESTHDAQSLIYQSQLTDVCIAGLRVVYANERVYFRGLRYEADTRGALSDQGQYISNKLVANMDIESAKLIKP